MNIERRKIPSDLNGGFRELLLLFFPILIISFSNFLYVLVEKLYLARLSVQAMEAAVNAAYAIMIIQIPCVALAMMAQVCVGRSYGAKEYKDIGPQVWQFIWFSLLSMLITIPLSIGYGKIYFQGTAIQETVMPYFYFLIAINFLYPLGTALSCFYLGQGKTRLVVIVTIGSQLAKLLLAYLFIFGWNFIPRWGLMGGAFSTLVAQASLCFVLLCVFLNSKNSAFFRTRDWRFRPKLFWECIHTGLLRAANRVLASANWASIAHLMTAKGGDYLLILSIGGTLFLFLPFLGDAICQAQTTVISHIIGARNYQWMNRAFRSGALLVFINVIIFGIPFLVFPSLTLEWLFPTVNLSEAMIRKIFLGVWTSFVFFTFSFVPISYILAFKDLRFSLFMGGFGWINGFLLMYVAIEYYKISADLFWLVLTLMHASTTFLYLWRMKWLQSQVVTAQPIQKQET